jgi:predicted nicotinamide N-methyase
MSANSQPLVTRKKVLSLDTWAVIVALAAALLIRAGVVSHVPW